MWTFKWRQKDEKRMPLAHGTESQVVHGCRETSPRNVTPYGSASDECTWVSSPLVLLCCPSIAAPTDLPPTHKGLVSLPQAFISKGVSKPWDQPPTGQRSPKQGKHSWHQTVHVQSADYFRRKFQIPTTPYQAWILERPKYNPKCQQGIVVPSRRQKAPGGNRHSGLSFWLPSPGTCCMAFSPRN